MPVPPAVAAGAERLDAICPGTVDEGYVRPAEQLIEPRRELFICGEVEPLVLDVRVDDVYRDDAQARVSFGRLQEDLVMLGGESGI